MRDAPPDYKYRNLDAANRLRDMIELHQRVLTTDEIFAGRFVAIQIADGGSDGVAYETREAAIHHNRNNPFRIVTWRVPFERVSAEMLDVLLWYMRTAYDNGVREDPRHHLIVPTDLEQVIGQIEATYGKRPV